MAQFRTIKGGGQTIVVLPADRDEMASVATNDRKWVNRMEELASQMLVEEVESSVEGCREWTCPREMIKLPVYRKPREFTEEQLEERRERLAGVRARVKAAREAAAKQAAAAAKKSGKKPAPAPEPPAVLAKGKKTSKFVGVVEEVEAAPIPAPITKRTGKGKDMPPADVVVKPVKKTAAAPVKPAPVPVKKSKRPVEPEPEDDEDLDEDLDDEIEELDDDEDEVIVKRQPVAKKTATAPATRSHGNRR